MRLGEREISTSGDITTSLSLMRRSDWAACRAGRIVEMYAEIHPAGVLRTAHSAEGVPDCKSRRMRRAARAIRSPHPATKKSWISRDVGNLALSLSA